jgi:hypothetical protein
MRKKKKQKRIGSKKVNAWINQNQQWLVAVGGAIAGAALTVVAGSGRGKRAIQELSANAAKIISLTKADPKVASNPDKEPSPAAAS